MFRRGAHSTLLNTLVYLGLFLGLFILIMFIINKMLAGAAA